jgi:hypothetical protein
MWTFTFAELLSIKDTRKRWNHFLTLLLRTWPELQGVRVFELHEEHGLHVHLATNRFIDVNIVRELAGKACWGRIHVMPMPAEHVEYSGKYLPPRGGFWETVVSHPFPRNPACALESSNTENRVVKTAVWLPADGFN